MSFNILYLNKRKLIEMYEFDNLSYIFKVNSIIFLDKFSEKKYKLIKKGKLKKLKKKLSKYAI